MDRKRYKELIEGKVYDANYYEQVYGSESRGGSCLYEVMNSVSLFACIRNIMTLLSAESPSKADNTYFSK